MKIKLLVISALLMIIGLGCTSLSYMLTPADIDQKAVKYSVEAGVADANDYGGWPWSNLEKAQKLMQDVDDAHLLNQTELKQLMERENLEYSIHKKSTRVNHQVALQREQALFGEKGLFSMGLTMLGVGGFSGILGLMRKRPQDVTPQEMQSALAEATGKKQEELTDKEKQFTQLVKGVQCFVDNQKGKEFTSKQTLDNLRQLVVSSGNEEAIKMANEISHLLEAWNGDVILSLKAAMDKYQDTDTQVAVAKVKKESV